MNSIEERNSKIKIKRTISLPDKYFTSRKEEKTPEENQNRRECLFASIGSIEDIQSPEEENKNEKYAGERVEEFLGDHSEKNEVKDLLLNLSVDQNSTDAESREEILSILNNNKKKMYSSNVLNSNLILNGINFHNQYPLSKSNSLNQLRGHEIPERISKPIFGNYKKKTPLVIENKNSGSKCQ